MDTLSLQLIILKITRFLYRLHLSWIVKKKYNKKNNLLTGLDVVSCLHPIKKSFQTIFKVFDIYNQLKKLILINISYNTMMILVGIMVSITSCDVQP